MRAISSIALLVMSLAMLPACSGIDECGDALEVTGEGEAAAGQASCAWRLAIDGVTYLPGCARVPPAELGDIIVDGESAGMHVVARTIVGVPQEQAVALFIKVPRDPDRQRNENRCGRWSMSSSVELDPRTARSMEKSLAAGAAA